MSEIIDLTKNSIGNCKFMQHAFFCKYQNERTVSTRYIMSMIVSNSQHYDCQQFQTLSCVHYTIFSVVKLDLVIRALLLDSILALEKNYAYARRTSCYLQLYFLPLLSPYGQSL